VKIGFGKLIEIAMQVPSAATREKVLQLAQVRLSAITLRLASPTVVLADASDSMGVAIRVGSIVAGALSALTDASLVFFNSKPFRPSKTPANVHDVLAVVQETKARGLTSPASALYDYLDQKTFVSCFVLISDEIENEPFKGQFFPTLFKRYLAEVNSKCVMAIVSFRENATRVGRMHSALVAAGIDPVSVIALSALRPDSTRIDSLLASLATSTTSWPEMIERVARDVADKLYCDERDAKAAAAGAPAATPSSTPAQTVIDVALASIAFNKNRL